MEIQTILSKPHQEAGKAAVPDQGTAAFFCSTETKATPGNTPQTGISPLFPTYKGGSNNLLPEKHYFCGGLAKHPPALVIRIEGQNRPFPGREVSA